MIDFGRYSPRKVLLPARVRTYLAQRELLGKVMANAGWLASDRLLRMGAGVVVTALTARHLGPGDFGALSFASAFVAMFTAVATLGLDGILLRDLVRYPEQRERLVGSALAIRLVGAALSSLAALLLIGWMRPNESMSQMLVLILAVGQFPLALDVFDVLLQSQMRVRRVALIRTGVFAVFAALRLILIGSGASVQCFALAMLGEQLVVALLLAGIAYSEGIRLPLSQARLGEVLRQLSESWPLVLSGLSVACYTRLDQVLLGQFLGNADVGIFAAGMRIIEAIFFIPAALASAAYPLLVAARAESVAALERKAGQLYDAMVLFGYVMALLLYLASPWLVRLLYGPVYAEAVSVTRIAAPVCVILCLSAVYSKWIIVEGVQRSQLAIAVLGAGFGLGANLLLIPSYGVSGAASAAVLAQFGPFLLLFLFPALRRNGLVMLRALVFPVGIFRLLMPEKVGEGFKR